MATKGTTRCYERMLMYDTILMTQEKIQQLTEQTQETEVPFFGSLKIVTVPDNFFDNIKTRDGKPCGAILIEHKDIALSFPTLKFTPIG